jgi:7-cyano-7-deazaguanine synthase
VGFDYGQRHRAELKRGRAFGEVARGFSGMGRRLGPDHLLPLDILKAIGGSALTDDVKIEMGENGLPTSFVPGRNLMFLTAAAALGYRRGIAELVGGMCETDFSGYPDCRDETVQATARALSLGLARPVTVHTPLMWIDKAATWRIAEQLGGKGAGGFDRGGKRHLLRGRSQSSSRVGLWLRQCPACELRAAGYVKYKAA